MIKTAVATDGPHFDLAMAMRQRIEQLKNQKPKQSKEVSEQ